MSRARFLSLFLRQFGLTLAALCLMLQAAVPAGFMVQTSESGFPLSVVICGDPGAAGAAPDLGLDHQDGAPADADQRAPCLFAGHGAGVVAPDLPALARSDVTYSHAEFPRPAFRSPATHTAAAPPPSRAPPAIV